MSVPVLIYDGDCAFCTTCARFIETRLPTRARITAWQHTDLTALGTTAARAQHEVLLITPAGRIHGGAQAVALLLIDAGGPWAIPGHLARISPFRWIAHAIYRLIAANRHRLPGGTPACAR